MLHVLLYLLVHVVQVFLLRLVKVKAQRLELAKVFDQQLAPVARNERVLPRGDRCKQLVCRYDFQLFFEDDLDEKVWDECEVRDHLAAQLVYRL